MRAILITLGAFLAVAGAGLWIALGIPSVATALSLTALRPLALPLIGVPLGAGIALILLGTDMVRDAAAAGRPSVLERPALATGAVAAGLSLLLVPAAATGKVAPLTAALVLVLGIATLLTLAQVLRDISDGNGVGFESHWGGLAGGMGGWRLSPSATTLLLAIMLIGGVIAAGIGGGGGDTATEDNGSAEGKGADGNDSADGNDIADGNDGAAEDEAADPEKAAPANSSAPPPPASNAFGGGSSEGGGAKGSVDPPPSRQPAEARARAAGPR